MREKKQFIIIMTDTQRTDMLGCYGHKEMKTPNIDSLAQEGILYEKAYSCSPVCGPARSALFTGLYPHSNGSWCNSIALGANVKTMGDRLTAAGIQTTYIGKWHLDGSDYFGTGECPSGWDPSYWYDMRSYLEELSPEERRLSRSSESCYLPEFTEEFTYGHRCSDRAIEFLQKYREQDFLLVLSYDEPHGPSLCPPEFHEMYKDYDFPRKPNIADPLDNKPEHQRLYAGETLSQEPEDLDLNGYLWRLLGCNSFVDYEIGRVLDSINENVPESTILYTSDHGDHGYSHRLLNKGATMYEENIHIPFILKNGKEKNRKVCSQPVSHIDLLPSVLDYFSIPCPPTLPGYSLLSPWKNPESEKERVIFSEFGRYEVDHDGFGGFQPIRCAFNGRYKLVINLLSDDELYDLENDKGEMVNLIKSEKDQRERDRLHNQLLNWMNETRDPFRGYYWEFRPWRYRKAPPTWEYTGMTRQRETEPGEQRQLDYDTGLEMEKAVRGKKRHGKSNE